jgi:type IV secretory pathway VirB10-like protein
MSDDILREASRALRHTTAEDNQGDRFTRARIMTSLHQRRQRRSTRIALLVPLAAILVGSTAWAGATGKLPEVWVFVADAIGVQVAEEQEEPPAEVKPAAGGKAEVRPAPAPEPPQAPKEEPEQTETQQDEAAAEARAEAAVRAPAKPKAARSATGPDTHLLYRAAHRAHFEQGDPAAALRGWDEYLRAAPSGRFSVEARYNRALCLVRLGRKAEARSALAPFARGAYGNYRQREAEQLVEALGGEVGTSRQVP